MKFLIIIITWIIILFPSLSLSQNIEIGGNISIANDNDNIESGIGINLYLDYPLNNLSKLRTSLGGYKTDSKKEILPEGTFTLIWINESFLIHKNFNVFDPFLGVGIGYYITDYVPSSENSFLIGLLVPDIIVHQEVENDIAMHIMGGFDIKVMSHIALNVEMKYIFLKPDFNRKMMKITPSYQIYTIKKELDLETFIYSFGITINF